MIYKFHAYGHPNILGTHKTTLEFTKDGDLSLNGDCIVGVKADFKLEKLKEFIKNSAGKKIIVTIQTLDKKIAEKVEAYLNPDFSSGKELVIRKTDFVSDRTLATKANKAAFELNRELINYLKEKGNKMVVIIKNKIK